MWEQVSGLVRVQLEFVREWEQGLGLERVQLEMVRVWQQASGLAIMWVSLFLLLSRGPPRG